jgi:hypothetical protein
MSRGDAFIYDLRESSNALAISRATNNQGDPPALPGRQQKFDSSGSQAAHVSGPRSDPDAASSGTKLKATGFAGGCARASVFSSGRCKSSSGKPTPAALLRSAGYRDGPHGVDILSDKAAGAHAGTRARRPACVGMAHGAAHRNATRRQSQANPPSIVKLCRLVSGFLEAGAQARGI